MGSQAWSAVLVPSSDPHLSEYLPERWQGRQWLSGFTGSAGTLIVAPARAALFADSRYWEQAEAELRGSGIDLVRMEGSPVAAYATWLADLPVAATPSTSTATDTPPHPTLAVDGTVLGMAQTLALRTALQAQAWQLHTADDPLAAIWPGRPGLPMRPPRAATNWRACAPACRPWGPATTGSRRSMTWPGC
jgi:Xaa-Pro aminopeptidase